MTAQRVGANVFCDGPDEQTDCPHNASFMDAGTAADIRARLVREDGWAVALPGGIDRCAPCTQHASLTTGSNPPIETQARP